MPKSELAIWCTPEDTRGVLVHILNDWSMSFPTGSFPYHVLKKIEISRRLCRGTLACISQVYHLHSRSPLCPSDQPL
jgi:hypothetical protein